MPTFLAAAQSTTKIQLQFSELMTIDAAFVTPANYTLVSLDGTAITISTVSQVGPDNSRAELVLGTNLVNRRHYAVTVNTNVTSATAQTVTPDTVVFQLLTGSTMSIPISNFSGEAPVMGVETGIFFSPALESAADSQIQVDSVEVCTKAYDSYTIPQSAPLTALYTYPAPTSTTDLIGEGVLLAKPPGLGAAAVVLSDTQEDTFPTPVDGPADAVLQEPLDLTRVSLLNSEEWETYPAATATIGEFKTADNLTAIGAGNIININLQA